MNTQAIIEQLLLDWAAKMPVAPAAISWPNRKFDPPIDGKYFQVRVFPNSNERLFLNGNDPVWRRGILQIGVVRPENEGTQNATVLADTIAAHFHSDLQLFSDDDPPVKVQVTNAPDIGSAINTD